MAVYSEVFSDGSADGTILTAAAAHDKRDGRTIDYVYIYNATEGTENTTQRAKLSTVDSDKSSQESTYFTSPLLQLSGSAKCLYGNVPISVDVNDQIKLASVDAAGGVLHAVIGWSGPSSTPYEDTEPDARKTDSMTSTTTATQDILSMVDAGIPNGRVIQKVTVTNTDTDNTEVVLIQVYDDSKTATGVTHSLEIPAGETRSTSGEIYLEDSDKLQYTCRNGLSVEVTCSYRDAALTIWGK